jgi:hypothetical protein
MWNLEQALSHLNTHAHATSLGRCAEYVRRAIEAGGVPLIRKQSAKDYGSSLEIVGFNYATSVPGNSNAGDVAVIQPIEGHPHGHMAMYNGQIWISDFRQYHGYYPSPSYRSIKPPVKVYRYPTLGA